MRAPRCSTHTHVQEIDACIAGWARRQRGGNLIGAFVVPVVMVSMAHRAGREDCLHIPQRKRWRICPSYAAGYAAGASLCRACRQCTLFAATALAVFASLRACCSIAFAAAAATPGNPASFSFWDRIRGASGAATVASATSANRLPSLSAAAMSGVGARRPAAGKDDAAACEALPRPATAAAPALLVPALSG
jgi:hypothetical protein